jgi:hypothetical protein
MNCKDGRINGYSGIPIKAKNNNFWETPNRDLLRI